MDPVKKLLPHQRASKDRSQTVRRGAQFAFLALSVCIGIQFYLFIRCYDRPATPLPGRAIRVSRPPGVERWLPIASLMNLKALFLTGEAPRIHPAGTFLLVAFLGPSWIFRKAFCGWLCPVGTISEYLWRLGRNKRFFLGRN